MIVLTYVVRRQPHTLASSALTLYQFRVISSRHGLRKRPNLIMLCIILLMFSCTTLHWATSIINAFTDLETVISASRLLCIPTFHDMGCDVITMQLPQNSRGRLQLCSWSSALTINVSAVIILDDYHSLIKTYTDCSWRCNRVVASLRHLEQ